MLHFVFVNSVKDRLKGLPHDFVLDGPGVVEASHEPDEGRYKDLEPGSVIEDASREIIVRCLRVTFTIKFLAMNAYGYRSVINNYNILDKS